MEKKSHFIELLEKITLKKKEICMFCKLCNNLLIKIRFKFFLTIKRFLFIN
jgi:hypothetical protein